MSAEEKNSTSIGNFRPHIKAAALLSEAIDNNQPSLVVQAMSVLAEEEKDIPPYHQELLASKMLEISEKINFSEEEVGHLASIDTTKAREILENWLRITSVSSSMDLMKTGTALRATARIYALFGASQEWSRYCLTQIESLEEQLLLLAQQPLDPQTCTEIDGLLEEMQMLFNFLGEENKRTILEKIVAERKIKLGDQHPLVANALVLLGNSLMLQEQDCDVVIQQLEKLSFRGHTHAGNPTESYPTAYKIKLVVALTLAKLLSKKPRRERQALRGLSSALADETICRESKPTDLIESCEMLLEMSKALKDSDIKYQALCKIINLYEKYDGVEEEDFNPKLIDALTELAEMRYQLGQTEAALQAARQAHDTLAMWFLFSGEEGGLREGHRVRMARCEKIIDLCRSQSKKKSQAGAILKMDNHLSQLEQDAKNGIDITQQVIALKNYYEDRPYVAAAILLDLSAILGEAKGLKFFEEGLALLFTKKRKAIPPQYKILLAGKLLFAVSVCSLLRVKQIVGEERWRDLVEANLREIHLLTEDLIENQKTRHKTDFSQLRKYWYYLTKFYFLHASEWGAWYITKIGLLTHKLAERALSSAIYFSNPSITSVLDELSEVISTFGVFGTFGIDKGVQKNLLEEIYIPLHRMLGEQHPLSMLFRQKLSIFYDGSKRIEEMSIVLAAFKNYAQQKNLPAKERHLVNQKVFNILLELSSECSLKKPQKALQYLGEIQALEKVDPQSVMPDGLASAFSLEVRIYQQNQLPVKAYKSLLKLLAFRENHPEIADPDQADGHSMVIILKELASACLKFGKRADAIAFKKRALEIVHMQGKPAENFLPEIELPLDGLEENQPGPIETKSALPTVLLELKTLANKQQALDRLNKELENRDIFREEKPGDIISVLEFHGKLNAELGQLKLAQASIERVVSLCEKYHTVDHFDSQLVNALMALANIHQGLGENEQGFEVASRAYGTLMMWLFHPNKENEGDGAAIQKKCLEQIRDCEAIMRKCKPPLSKKARKKHQAAAEDAQDVSEMPKLPPSAVLSELAENVQKNRPLSDRYLGSLEKEYASYLLAAVFFNLSASTDLKQDQERYFAKAVSLFHKFIEKVPSYHKALLARTAEEAGVVQEEPAPLAVSSPSTEEIAPTEIHSTPSSPVLQEVQASSSTVDSQFLSVEKPVEKQEKEKLDSEAEAEAKEAEAKIELQASSAAAPIAEAKVEEISETPPSLASTEAPVSVAEQQPSVVTEKVAEEPAQEGLKPTVTAASEVSASVVGEHQKKKPSTSATDSSEAHTQSKPRSWGDVTRIITSKEQLGALPSSYAMLARATATGKTPKAPTAAEPNEREMPEAGPRRPEPEQAMTHVTKRSSIPPGFSLDDRMPMEAAADTLTVSGTSRADMSEPGEEKNAFFGGGNAVPSRAYLRERTVSL